MRGPMPHGKELLAWPAAKVHLYTLEAAHVKNAVGRERIRRNKDALRELRCLQDRDPGGPPRWRVWHAREARRRGGRRGWVGVAQAGGRPPRHDRGGPVRGAARRGALPGLAARL
ncbi:unnamed protein product [Prorocentrum cordatum]|uniref:Uncharacterized protein n=1 Tax=Prorocentrum cordatum TaxID=2364126 RepID=A0ABN9PI20_9DINO|nr:unnamed protein product [Polarella glacialis]